MAEERRESPRTKSRLTAVFKDLETGRVQRVLTKDLSSKGVCLVTEGLLRPGTRLQVDLQLPDRATPLTVQAEVVWSRAVDEPGTSDEVPTVETGVIFTHLSPTELTLIKHYAAIYGFP
jgi:hypothetical protein